MPYVDGFVLAVPTAHKERFIEHARTGNAVFMEQGATRIWECWGDDVKAGERTDFRRAVAAKDDETVCFSWIEWPSKEVRDAAMARMEELMKDPRMDQAQNPMPFDAGRMIYGGFVPVVTLGG